MLDGMPIFRRVKAGYERLYVAFYGWSLRVDGNDGKFNILYATLMLSLAQLINVATIIVIVEMATGWLTIGDVAAIPKSWWIGLAVAIAGSQLLYFGSHERSKKLIALHAGSEGALRKRAPWKIVAYMIASYAGFVVLIFVRFNLTH